MARPGLRKVQRYSVAFKRAAVRLSRQPRGAPGAILFGARCS